METRIKLNLESDIGMELKDIHHYFAKHGEFKVLQVKQNGITYIVDIILAPVKIYKIIETIWDFCREYHQDCIAIATYKADGAMDHGILSGPKAAEWGAFNPAYFKE